MECPYHFPWNWILREGNKHLLKLKPYVFENKINASPESSTNTYFEKVLPNKFLPFILYNNDKLREGALGAGFFLSNWNYGTTDDPVISNKDQPPQPMEQMVTITVWLICFIKLTN